MSQSAEIVTREGIGSYMKVFRPEAFEQGDEPKFSASLIFNKSDTAALEEIRAAYRQVLQEDFDGVLPYGAKPANGDPLVDGAVRYPGDEFYADKMILSASCGETHPPQVQVWDEGATMPRAATKPSEVYSGCFCKFIVAAYGYQGGSKGISFSLRAVLKTRDGESLGGTAMSEQSAASKFADAAGAASAAPTGAPGAITPPPAPGAPGAIAPPTMTPPTPPAEKKYTYNGAEVLESVLVQSGWSAEQIATLPEVAAAPTMAPPTMAPPTMAPPAPVEKKYMYNGAEVLESTLVQNGWTAEQIATLPVA